MSTKLNLYFQLIIMNRPITTLFMNMSVDWKISTGDNDTMDTCFNYPKIKWIGEGYKQYYEIEQTTDLHSLNSARVLTKSHNWKSINEPQNFKKTIVSFILIDRKPHLTTQWVKNLLQKSKTLYIVTNNQNHPAFALQNEENLKIIFYEKNIDFNDLFQKFKQNYGIEKITIQTWGTLNAIFLRKNLIDKLSVVIVPVLTGGKNTSTLIDGESLHSIKELSKIKTLKLTETKQLKNSYLHLKYDINPKTKIIT